MERRADRSLNANADRRRFYHRRCTKMTISEMTDLIALMEAFGERVKFSAPDYE